MHAPVTDNLSDVLLTPAASCYTYIPTARDWLLGERSRTMPHVCAHDFPSLSTRFPQHIPPFSRNLNKKAQKAHHTLTRTKASGKFFETPHEV